MNYHCISFDELVTLAVSCFFHAYGHCFSIVEDVNNKPQFVCTKKLTSKNLITKLIDYMGSAINERYSSLFAKNTVLDPHIFLLIGSCKPTDNLLLRSLFEYSFDKKISYELKEKDIILGNGIESLDSIFDFVLDKLFRSRKNPFHVSEDKSNKNMIVIKNKYLDERTIYQILKQKYGKSLSFSSVLINHGIRHNPNNIDKTLSFILNPRLSITNSPLNIYNRDIDKQCRNKHGSLISSLKESIDDTEINQLKSEIFLYIDHKIKTIFNIK